MRRVIHIASALMAAVLAFISCERADVNRPDVQEGGRPIQFTVESEWPEITKATSTTINAFRVWGTWTKDPSDVSNTAGIEEIVFGSAGAEVTKDENDWVLAEEADWYQGYYNFAAVYPSTFSATQAATFTESTMDGQTVQEYANLLTIDLSAGLNLSADQTDLMYAFDCVDNSANDASAVGLTFNHIAALLTIKITSSSASIPAISKVTIYGIHSKVYGNLEIQNTLKVVGGVGQTPVITNNLSSLIADDSAVLSTSTAPYAEFTINSSESSSEVTLVDRLLVFPETLSSACALRIEIEYPGSDDILYAEVDSGSWAMGSNNVYTLTIE